jgi:superoxide dismutase, Fe-Mn family
LQPHTLIQMPQWLVDLEFAPLPFGPAGLEPYLSDRALALHHGRIHHAAELEVAGSGRSLEALLASAAASERALAGAALCHRLFWRSLKPGGGTPRAGPVAEQLAADFGGLEEFEAAFLAAALGLVGSGFLWLVWEPAGASPGALQLLATANYDLPDLARRTPLLALDLWEHAYIHDYAERRADYVAGFLDSLANWDMADAVISGAR